MSEQTIPQSLATAEQLLAHLLDLTVSCDSIRDATPERVSTAFGVDLAHQPDGTFTVKERLTAHWWYLLLLAPDFALGPRLSFTVIDNDGGHSGPMTEIRSLDLDQFTSALEAADFAHTETYGEHGRHYGRLFRRGDLQVDVLIRGEANQPDTISHRCIWSVQLS